jgi:eukaryotic-like serine/threonine-protein kinase
MCAENRCRTCGNALPNGTLPGLCPVCLFREGLAGDGSAVATGPFMSGTQGTTSALATLDKSLGGLPHVLLRDSELNEGPGPLVQPGSPEMPAVGYRTGRLQLLGEIARGGMGAVLKGRDPDLGRDLAVKVLLESHRDKPELIRRFVEEAQIGGQLQHPGIVPIYELGAFADHRPYFAMKLVKGRTLSSLLDERSDQVHDLPRFLSIFESVCQTIAYAHARGVIHRDLKPSNIMVGSFGEVQVMDWGLAKVLPQGGVADDVSAGKTRDRDTVIATARSGKDPDSDLSRAGSVMGTPSYMAPEQARGEVERLDERCDVFALGSILCELLTGEPAFIGRSSGEIQRKASRGELEDALDRLSKRGSDAELIALAKDCLATELEDRPRHAGEVAAQINAYQMGVQERLRRTEIARAEEKARVEEATKRARVERDRLRLTVALAASVIGLIVLGAGGWVYLAQANAARRASIERVVSQALDEASQLRGQAKAAAVGDLSKWPLALAEAKKARTLLAAGDPDAKLEKRVETLMSVLEKEQTEATRRSDELQKDRRFLERLEAIRVGYDHQHPEKTEMAYARVFREFGVDLDQLEPSESGRRLAQRSDPVEFAFFLDDWIWVRREAGPRGDFVKKQEEEKHEATWRRLVAAVRVVDPDPWRDELRKEVGNNNSTVARRLAEDEGTLSTRPSRSLLLLVQLLGADHDSAIKERILMRAWRLSPDDSRICSELARCRSKMAVRFATAAVALRPRSAGTHYLLAESVLPEDARLSSISLTTKEEKTPKAKTGPSPELLEGIVELREAIRLRPEEGLFHYTLASVLYELQGRRDEAIAEYREAYRLAPDELTFAGFVAFVLFNNGKRDEAIQVVRKALPFSPFVYSPLFDDMMRIQGKKIDRVELFRNAVRLSPDFAGNHFFLGDALMAAGNLSEAFIEYKEAIRLRPEPGRFHNNLGYYRLQFGEVESALADLREVLRIEPRNASYLDSLGWAQLAHGELKESLANVREADRLEKSSNPEIQSHLKLVERLSALESRLDTMVHGQDVPPDAEGKLDVAELCRVTRRFAASAKFYRDAFQAKPALADDLSSQHRLHAAFAAAQAGTTPTPPKDDIRLDDAERARWRAQGLDWLRGQKDACAKIITTTVPATAAATPAVAIDQPNLALARKTLDIMTHHRDLACVRDEKELAKLPEPERKEWQAFWSEVAALLKKADRN